MSNFDSLHPEVTPTLLDLAYGDAEEMIESYITLWRKMKAEGMPDEILAIAEETRREDEMFFRGGCVALETMLSEFAAKRDSIFLGG